MDRCYNAVTTGTQRVQGSSSICLRATYKEMFLLLLNSSCFCLSEPGLRDFLLTLQLRGNSFSQWHVRDIIKIHKHHDPEKRKLKKKSKQIYAALWAGLRIR